MARHDYGHRVKVRELDELLFIVVPLVVPVDLEPFKIWQPLQSSEDLRCERTVASP